MVQGVAAWPGVGPKLVQLGLLGTSEVEARESDCWVVDDSFSVDVALAPSHSSGFQQVEISRRAVPPSRVAGMKAGL